MDRFPNYFADAEASLEQARYVIFGVPFSKTSAFRYGADKAPHAIRQASWNFETYDIQTKVDLQDVDIHDYGDVEVDSCSSEEMVKITADTTSNFVEMGKFLIGIGGEHCITPGIVSGFYNAQKPCCVLCLDAHLDFREEYEEDRNSHACALRRIADFVPIEDIVSVGFRSAEKEELNDAVQRGLTAYDGYVVREQGLGSVLERVKKQFQGRPIYLSIDIDVIDPCYVPATSTPEPFGWSPEMVVEVIKMFSNQLIGADLVEVCPGYDHGQSAILAAKLIRLIIAFQESSFFS